jgi:hypothetical protein
MSRERMTSSPRLATMGAGAVERMDLATQTCIPCHG